MLFDCAFDSVDCILCSLSCLQGGGVYSRELHCGCTHLIATASHSRKQDFARRHAGKLGLCVVGLQWFYKCLATNKHVPEGGFPPPRFGSSSSAGVRTPLQKIKIAGLSSHTPTRTKAGRGSRIPSGSAGRLRLAPLQQVGRTSCA